MKTLKSGIASGCATIKKGLIWTFAVCLIFSFSTIDLEAQKSSDLDEEVILQMERLFEEQIQILTEEIESQYHSVDVDLKKSIIHFYLASTRDFRDQDVNLRVAFEQNLDKIAPPKYNNTLTGNLFEQGWTGSNSQTLVKSDTPYPPKSSLTAAINNLNISGGDYSSVHNLINLINQNR